MTKVEAAIKRAEESGEWNTRTPGTESQRAFLDRRLLAAEVKRLRAVDRRHKKDAIAWQQRYERLKEKHD